MCFGVCVASRIFAPGLFGTCAIEHAVRTLVVNPACLPAAAVFLVFTPRSHNVVCAISSARGRVGMLATRLIGERVCCRRFFSAVVV